MMTRNEFTEDMNELKGETPMRKEIEISNENFRIFSLYLACKWRIRMKKVVNHRLDPNIITFPQI